MSEVPLYGYFVAAYGAAYRRTPVGSYALPGSGTQGIFEVLHPITH